MKLYLESTAFLLTQWSIVHAQGTRTQRDLYSSERIPYIVGCPPYCQLLQRTGSIEKNTKIIFSIHRLQQDNRLISFAAFTAGTCHFYLPESGPRTDEHSRGNNIHRQTGHPSYFSIPELNVTDSGGMARFLLFRRRRAPIIGSVKAGCSNCGNCIVVAKQLRLEQLPLVGYKPSARIFFRDHATCRLRTTFASHFFAGPFSYHRETLIELKPCVWNTEVSVNSPINNKTSVTHSFLVHARFRAKTCSNL